jgi:hypothetical protein
VDESEERLATEEDIDPNQDRRPSAVAGLRRIVQAADLPDGQVEYLECAFLADGSGTWRVRLVGADETEGGYLAP